MVTLDGVGGFGLLIGQHGVGIVIGMLERIGKIVMECMVWGISSAA